jgi:hypothetical protein
VLAHGWQVALTGLFSATTAYCFWRLATARSQGIEAVVDVNHILMGPAMLLMVWWPSATGAKWLQLAVFAGMAVVFARHLSGLVTVTGRTGALLHAGMNLGMVWMLLAMPTLMTADPAMAMDMPGHQHFSELTGTRIWAAMGSWIAVGLMILAAAWWIFRVLRAPGHRMLCTCHALTFGGMAAMLGLMTPAL